MDKPTIAARCSVTFALEVESGPWTKDVSVDQVERDAVRIAEEIGRRLMAFLNGAKEPGLHGAAITLTGVTPVSITLPREADRG